MVFFPFVVKMKLLLALSVVLIALSVLAEPSSAESQEPSVKEKFKNIGEAIKDAAVKVGEKAKSVIKDLHDSKFGTKTRELFTEGIQKIKNKFSK
ncbi:apolipoprotein C-I-like isoform X2 [Bufo gargarizans]|uniref:apolipoprotein C-I-like isoform X2 n=1 Tax=Bufo gargarizans TaxID=30331 RepID=UPI001CF51E3A|nr:apolipoprotein C-I-like isoform X2 [Bufo gargarizans]